MRTVLALALVLSGCSSIFGPEITQWGNHPMEPVPSEYATWYADVEACWDRTGDYAAVEWWIADKIEYGNAWAGGLTRGDRITMTLGYDDSERHVRHEISHHVSGLGGRIHYRDEYGRHRARCDEG